MPYFDMTGAALEFTTKELAIVRADRDNERHMRHQADGRAGSGVREANKEVREQASIWKKQYEN